MEMMLVQVRLTFGLSDEILEKRIKQKFAKVYFFALHIDNAVGI